MCALLVLFISKLHVNNRKWNANVSGNDKFRDIDEFKTLQLEKITKLDELYVALVSGNPVLTFRVLINMYTGP